MFENAGIRYCSVPLVFLFVRYDVRGEIYLAAVKRTQEGKKVIYTNVGNPQALGQAPLTFNRQVMSLVRFFLFLVQLCHIWAAYGSVFAG